MKLRPTGLGIRGALFFATVVLLFFATPYSNLFFLLTAFLAVLSVQAVSGCYRNLHGVTAELRSLQPAAAGSGHEIEILLHAGNRPRFGLRVVVHTAGGKHLVELPPIVRGDVLVTGRIGGLPRGVHDVKTLRVQSQHPFGMCRGEVACAAEAEAVAYPTPAPLRAGRDPWAGLGEGHLALASVGVEAVAYLREFRTGDRLRDVHWKASARRGVPVVKEREGEASAGLVIRIDRRLPRERFESALSQACAILLRASVQHRSVQLRSQGHQATYGDGHHPLPEALRWLAGAKTLPDDAPAVPPSTAGHLELPLAEWEGPRA